jgi:glycine/D-amino acid oxidase-like deaminating enzyme
VREWDESKGQVILRLSNAHKVLTKKVVLAAGYESSPYLPKNLVRLKSTYAIATHPLKGRDLSEHPLIWETAQPYHYVRTTGDRRIIIGGEDEDFIDPKERDRLIPQKSRRLEKAIERFCPGVGAGAKAQYTWAGTFGETKDGLPYVGTMRGRSHIIYALCYGANGTNFSVMAANIIRDRIQRKKSRDAQIFSLDR